MTDLVTVAEQDTHLLLTMDDGKANALGFEMFDALNRGLDAADAAGKVVVIAGRPGKFSAGFDLNIMGGGGDDMLRLLRSGADLAHRLMDFATPVVLAVTGHALAMGAMICLSADYRIGTRGNYKLGLNEAAIGMTLPWFGIELARARLTPAHFSQAVGLAWIYDAEAAVTAGFLDQAVEEQALMPTAEAVAQAASGLNFTAHRNSKRRIREAFFASYQQALQKDFDQGAVMASIG